MLLKKLLTWKYVRLQKWKNGLWALLHVDFSCVLNFACAIQKPVESSVIYLQGYCQKPCSLCECNKTSSLRSRAEPLDCLRAAQSKLSKYQFYTLLHSRELLPQEIQCLISVRSTGQQLWYTFIYIIWRHKRHFYCICNSYHVQDWERHIKRVFVQWLLWVVTLSSFWRISSHRTLTNSWNSGLTHNIPPSILTSLPPYSSKVKKVLICICRSVSKPSELLPTKTADS